MAKKTLTQSTVATDNIQNQPDQVVDQAAALKLAFDKYGIDSKQYNNNVLLVELQSETIGDAGANAIGTEGTFGTDNVADELKAAKVEIDTKAGIADVVTLTGTQIVTGEKTFQAIKVPVLPSATTDPASKKYVDDTAFNGVPLGNPLEFLRTNAAGDGVEYNNLPNDNESNITTNTTNIDTNKTNLNIIRTSKNSTGTANAIELDTDGTFDLARDGNLLPFTPSLTNTGASTIEVDSQTAKSIKKFDIDGDAYIDVEAGDIKKNTPLILTWDSGNDFFVLAPKSGAIVKSVQSGLATISNVSTFVDVNISAVDQDNSIIIIERTTGNSVAYNFWVTPDFVDNDTIRLERGNGTGADTKVYYKVVEFTKLKSKQSGSGSTSSSSVNVAITSVDTSKALPLVYFKTTSGGAAQVGNWGCYFTSPTVLRLEGESNSGNSYKWQVAEFA